MKLQKPFKPQTRFAALLLIVMLLGTFVFAGCGKKEDAKDAPPLPNKVALLLPYAEADLASQNAIQQTLLTEFESYAQRYELEVTRFFAAGDAAMQSAQIGEAVEAGTGTVVVIPVSGGNENSGLDDGMKAALDASIPLIALHENANTIYNDTTQAPISSVVPDYEKAVKGLLAAAAEAHPGTETVLLNGPVGDVTADFIAEQATEATIVNSDWTVQGGRTAVEALLKEKPSLGSIVVANASMATGAVKAVADAKLNGKVAIYALNPSGLNAEPIKSDAITMAAVPDAESEAMTAVSLCVKLIARKNVKLNNLVPFLTVTKDNADTYLTANE